MAPLKTLRCPVCKKPLSQREYERALGILDAREQHLEHEKADLQRRLKEARERERRAREAGVLSERTRTQRLLKGKVQEIQRLKERVKHLRRGTTPQTEGLEFEETLTARLRREFPGDTIEHKGKGGDVLQTVRVGNVAVGIIVYECKRSPSIKEQHVRQAAAARRARSADFAVLVTTGRRRGFTGLSKMADVLVVSPLGVLALAGLLRASLIEMHKAKVAVGRRNQLARRMLDFVTGPQFRNPIEHLVSAGDALGALLEQEARDHLRTWQRRKEHYENIVWDASLVRDNVQLVLSGKSPKQLATPKRSPLRLPAVAGGAA